MKVWQATTARKDFVEEAAREQQHRGSKSMQQSKSAAAILKPPDQGNLKVLQHAHQLALRLPTSGSGAAEVGSRRPG